MESITFYKNNNITHKVKVKTIIDNFYKTKQSIFWKKEQTFEGAIIAYMQEKYGTRGKITGKQWDALNNANDLYFNVLGV